MYNTRNRSKAIIVDLDGTLSDNRHRLNIIDTGDWDRYNAAGAEDRPVAMTVDAVNAFAMMGYSIIIFTGREETHAKSTIEWLDNARVTWHCMEMRPAGDYNSNEDIKKRWYRAYASEFEIVCAFEDQPRTCEMWKSLGVPVFKVELDE